MENIVIRDCKDSDWERLQIIHDKARMLELKAAGLTDAFIPLVEATKAEELFDYTVKVALLDGKVLCYYSNNIFISFPLLLFLLSL